MDSTSVAFKNDTMIYESYSSDELFFTVKMAFGWPGSGLIANSFMAMPCRRMRSDERAPVPHSVYNCGISSSVKLCACMSSTGHKLSIVSIVYKLVKGRGSKNTGS